MCLGLRERIRMLLHLGTSRGQKAFPPFSMKVQGSLIIAGALEKRLSERKFLE